jgi:hypothetical protein
MQLLSPPFRAQYLRLERSVAQQFETPEDRVKNSQIDGIFCFVSRPESSGKENDLITVIELVIVYNQDNRITARLVRGPLIEPNETVTEWVDGIAGSRDGQRSAQDDAFVKLLNYMVKVFLYLGLKDARKEVGTDYSTMLKRLAALGPKKHAKAQRRLEHLYDRIRVGPANMPATHTAREGATGRAPHWRRGHFRMQPCGPSWSSRKLIFVAPILIHADRLGDEAPRPKPYELTAGRARP